MTIIPILLYHSISADPADWIAPYTVSPDSFVRHLDAIVDGGFTPMSVSDVVDGIQGRATLPAKPVVVTVDDGFADFAAAAEQLAVRHIPSTLYVATGALEGADDVASGWVLPPAKMLAWSQLAEIAESGVEIGAHTHTHPQLDAMHVARARHEIRISKQLLEDHLGREVPSFAYPHGFQSARLRQEVRAAGYRSAVGVMDALSSTDDRAFCLARLTVRASTPHAELTTWLAGRGARVAPFPEALKTKAWRMFRRSRGPRFTRGVVSTRPARTKDGR
ncbi:polysaccharide deacetylase family protein [Mycobacterium yunnanensis]|uniref:Polysaccharide deacetylase family protein n=1 Tax=Mycobacterium yunnanensis TaxID=368477 RepID=A0A9X2YW09_9MYCO|nr:polysaccharide deacetylase family protein [Mycobacterium yunnanensis]MCV7418950.1 polysaccharide deacetylase family protein [Mycobacterium yunnanensis]